MTSHSNAQMYVSAPLRALAKELTETPVGFTPPFPSDLSKKPLAELMTGRLHEDEIEHLWHESFQTLPKEAAKTASDLFDTYHGIQSKAIWGTAEQREAIDDYVSVLEQARPLPQLVAGLKMLATGKNAEGNDANRVELVMAQSSVRRNLPHSVNALKDIVLMNEIARDLAGDQGLQDFAVGMEHLAKAGIEPQSLEHALSVARTTVQTEEERQRRQNEAQVMRRDAEINLQIASHALAKMHDLKALVSLNRGTNWLQ